MTWLDRVLAVPTIGFSLTPELLSDHEVVTSIRPLFDAWAKEGEVSIQQKDMSLAFQTASGYKFSIDHNVATVEFAYRFELKDRPGTFPVFPQLETEKYSVLLERIIGKTNEFIEHVFANRRRNLVRLGIVATSRIDGENLPPGVALYIEHLQRPWGKPLIRCDSNLVSVLREDEKTRDQCHHRLSFDQGDKLKKNDFRFVLDWQRVMLTPTELRSGSSRGQLQSASSSALDYFEKFGRGELDYGSAD